MCIKGSFEFLTEEGKKICSQMSFYPFDKAYFVLTFWNFTAAISRRHYGMSSLEDKLCEQRSGRAVVQHARGI